MLVSFLVPVYNVEKYLEECIESLLIQKGAPFEIVLLDDGSTDSSGAICDSYARKYPDTIRVIHKDNEGLLMTRRRGFKEANGDWFICVDSDDYVDMNLLEQIAVTIEKHDCDMVMYNYQYADDAGNKTPSRLKMKDGTIYTENNKKELYLNRLFSTNINNMWLRAIRKDIVDIAADYSHCGIRNMCEDAVQVLPLYTNTRKTVYIDKKLYYYRKNDASITGKVSWGTWESINRSFVLTQPYLDRWNISTADRECFYTKQMEVICNCVRWIFNQEADVKEKEIFLKKLKVDSKFDECRKYFNKMYCSTNYMKFVVPLLIKAIESFNIKKINMILSLEKRMRRK